MEKRLQTIANVVIIVTGLAVTSLVVQKLWSRSQAAVDQPTWRIGELVDIGDVVDFSRAERTLLLAVHTRCLQCTRAMPFVRELVNHREPGLRLVVIAREPAGTVAAYLRQHNLGSFEVAEVGFQELRVRRLPSLLIVDRRGHVVGSWSGPVAEPPDQTALVSLGLIREEAGEPGEEH